MPNNRFEWDPYSDQPKVIRDKKRRWALYVKGAWGTIKTSIISLYLLFLSPVIFFIPRSKRTGQKTKLGLCVNISTPTKGKNTVPTEQLRAMVDDLKVSHLLIRIPLADIEGLRKYIEFISAFDDKKIVINILQDRRHIIDSRLRKASLEKIFSAFNGRVQHYQIGNAINRRKWAFASLDEYFSFFATAYQLKNRRFPQIKLLGGSIIDFEMPNFTRTLYHRYGIHYDGIASQLYVDRRGAPENRQLGCDLLAKIAWLKTLTDKSRKTENRLWITETNWPLKGTEPFAPAIGDCMIDEFQQATYLARYYLLAMASGRVHACFWHQLIAPGYGLVDNREDPPRKRRAYDSFKLLLQLFSDATINDYSENRYGLYRLVATNQGEEIEALWTNGAYFSAILPQGKIALDLTGNIIPPEENNLIHIKDNVVYFVEKFRQAS